ncbi:MAG TPA: tetratricopeptide repeat protein, partial [Myxococcaceae bacterium]|nr:tetratricopeptide repeat protein [Myxococcaceae bacterium]
MSQQRAEQLVEAGLWLKLSGDTDGARRLFEQALRLDPQNARAKQLLESRPASPPPDVGPPGVSAPPSNVAGRSPIEQDWAMATGIIAERQLGQTPPPVQLSRDASVPGASARPPEDPLHSTVPWVADGKPAGETLIWGKSGAQRTGGPAPAHTPPPTVPWMTGFTPPSGVVSAGPGPPPATTPTIPMGQLLPPPAQL